MIRFSSIVLLFVTLFVTGCASEYYPDSLRGGRTILYKYGRVDNGTYTTKIGCNWWGPCKFSLLVPQAYNFYNAHFMTTREVYGKNYTYVQFGPSAYDDTVYRILVVYKGRMPLSIFKCLYQPWLIDLGAKGYDRQMFKIYQNDFDNFYGHPGMYEVYMQVNPGIYLYYSRRQPGNVIITHSFNVVDYGNVGVIFWIQSQDSSGINSVDKKNRYQIIHQIWWPQVRWTRSFVLCCNYPHPDL